MSRSNQPFDSVAELAHDPDPVIFNGIFASRGWGN